MIKDMLLIHNKEYIINYINENKIIAPYTRTTSEYHITDEISIQLNLNE